MRQPYMVPTWSRIGMTRTISESNHSVRGTSFQNTINQCPGFIFLFFCPTFGSYCIIPGIISDFQYKDQLKSAIIQSSCTLRPTAFIANGVFDYGSLVTLRYRKMDTLLPAIVVTVDNVAFQRSNALTGDIMFCIGDFVSVNSADPYEMSHYAAFYLGLHCLSKFRFRVSDPQRV